MLPYVLIVVSFVVLSGGVAYLRHGSRLRRERYILAYRLPPSLLHQLGQRHPALGEQDIELVVRALKQFFLAYLHGGFRFVAMPSQLTDDLWHEFILCTRLYELFCHKAFGRFLHHTPASVLSRNQMNNKGLRRVWRECCRQEGIDAKKPGRLPLLFALDSRFNVEGGFLYAPDCSVLRRQQKTEDGYMPVHCGADFMGSDFSGSGNDFDSCHDGVDCADGGCDSGGDSGCGGCCGGD